MASTQAVSSSRVPVTLRDFFWDDPFFKSSWDDFDRLRQEMMQQSKDMWHKFEEEMKSLESRMSSSMQMSSNSSIEQSSSTSVDKSSSSLDKSNSALENKDNAGVICRMEDWMQPMFFPRRWMLPKLFSEDFSEKLDIFKGKDDQVIRVKEDEGKFEVSLDTHQYRPDELKVNVDNNVLAISAKHEEKSDDGCKFVSRQFARKYTLPEGCLPDKVTSNLSSDGILMVTAPKVNALNHGNRSIPIQNK